MDFIFYWLFGPFRFIFILFFIVFGIRMFSRLIRRLTHDFDDPYSEKSRLSRPGTPRSLYDLTPDESEDESGYALDSRSGVREVEIFRVADKMKGRITLSDVVLETGIGMKESEQILEKMVDGMHVRMEVDDRGIVVYEFPEIIRRYEEGGR